MISGQLQQDLERDRRDAMYRASKFIARHGGPCPIGDSKLELVAHRAAALRWLQAQPDPGALADAYAAFVMTWSPVFKD